MGQKVCLAFLPMLQGFHVKKWPLFGGLQGTVIIKTKQWIQPEAEKRFGGFCQENPRGVI